MHRSGYIPIARTRALNRIAILLTVITVASLMTVSSASAGTVNVRPGQSLAAVARAHPRGTVFRLSAGTFRTGTVQLQSQDKVLGAGRGATFVRFSAPIGFDTSGATGVEIAHLDLSGVHGTKRTCGKWCGRGISRGINAYYHDLRSHHNSALGIGGTLTSARIANVELDHNGSTANIGCCSSGIKSGTSYSIVNSYVHDNIGNGIWCDKACNNGDPMIVTGNRSINNTLDGIHLEWSQGVNATVQGNYVRGSGRNGVHIAQFGYAKVLNNNIDGSRKAGINFNSGSRGHARGLSDGNRADGIVGCNLP